MSDIEPEFKASVSTIWTEALLEGEVVRVSSSGASRIIIGGFDIHVPGEFGGVDEVIAAYKCMIEEQSIAYAKMVDDSDEASCCNNLLAISQEELDELDALVLEFEKQCKVICMKTRKTI